MKYLPCLVLMVLTLASLRKKLRSLMAALQEPPMTLIAVSNGFWKHK